MPRGVDETKRTTPMMKTVFKRDVCTALYGRWTKTVIATLYVIIQIFVFKLRQWTRFLRSGINGFADSLILAFYKSIEKSMSATRVVYSFLVDVIEELSNTINEIFGVDLIVATSDLVGNLVTGSNYVQKIVGVLKASVIVRVKASDQSTAPACNVCGEQQEKIQLPLKNDLFIQSSDIRPKMSVGKSKYKSILINKRTIAKCEERPEKRLEIITNTQQTSYGRWTKTTMATLNVIIQILVFKLRQWTRFLRSGINGFFDTLILAFNKSIEKSMSVTRVVYSFLGVVIGELSNTIIEIFGVDIIVATSDLVGNLVTGSNYVQKIVRASKASMIVKVEASDQSAAPAGIVCGEKQEKIQLPLKNDLYEQISNIRPKLSVGKSKYKSILINKRPITKCEEHLEKCIELITNTPQPSVLKFKGLMYEDLTPSAGPIVSCGPDEMAHWRRETFFEDNKATVTPETAKSLDSTVRERDTSSANRDRTTEERDSSSMDQYRMTERRDTSAVGQYRTKEGRETSSVGQYRTMEGRETSAAAGQYRPTKGCDRLSASQYRTTEGCDTLSAGLYRTTKERDLPSTGKYRTTAARHLHLQNSATRPRPQKDTTCRRPVPDNSVPLTAVPPPPGHKHFWHGNVGSFMDPRYSSSLGPFGPFASPPQPEPGHLWHGPPGPFLRPPLPGPGYLSSHGSLGPFAGTPPPGLGHLSHRPPGPFVGPPMLGPQYLSSHGPLGPFAGPPPQGPEQLSHGPLGPFVEPPLITSGYFRHTRPDLITEPLPPTSRRF